MAVLFAPEAPQPVRDKWPVWGTGRHCYRWKRTADLGREPPLEPGTKRKILPTHGRRKAQPASAPARSSRKAEVTSVFANWNCRGLAGVCESSGESPAGEPLDVSWRYASSSNCPADRNVQRKSMLSDACVANLGGRPGTLWNLQRGGDDAVRCDG